VISSVIDRLDHDKSNKTLLQALAEL